jgi:hypothetical protein
MPLICINAMRAYASLQSASPSLLDPRRTEIILSYKRGYRGVQWDQEPIGAFVGGVAADYVMEIDKE